MGEYMTWGQTRVRCHACLPWEVNFSVAFGGEGSERYQCTKTPFSLQGSSSACQNRPDTFASEPCSRFFLLLWSYRDKRNPGDTRLIFRSKVAFFRVKTKSLFLFRVLLHLASLFPLYLCLPILSRL